MNMGQIIAGLLPAGECEGVEVGVFRGSTSSQLLKTHKQVRWWMVDLWGEWGGDGQHNPGNQPHTKQNLKSNFIQTIRNTWVHQRRTHYVRCDSVRAAMLFPDGSLDLVFIDANHAFDGVSADIAAWLPKVKPGGVLCGHDYHTRFPGVIEAVDALRYDQGMEIELHGKTIWSTVIQEK